MKKSLKLFAIFTLIATFVAGLTAPFTAKAAEKIDTIKIGFVPSRNPDEIVTSTEPLKQLLKDELAKNGFEVENVEITVGTNFEAVGEGLASGTLDYGFIPSGTYVLFSDDVEVLLTATRQGLNKNSAEPKDWNDKKATEPTDEQVTFYKGLVLAGPSAKGKELAEKVNKGEKLTWDDLNSAKWTVLSSSSASGYIYPTLWLKENFGKKITDLANVVQSDSYTNAMTRLAAEQVDIVVGYADLRRDNVDKWQKEMGASAPIWETTNVIGVTPDIVNDTVSASKTSTTVSPELNEAIKKALMDIAKTEEGKKVIKIYNHTGYKEAKDEDYNKEREAQKLIKGN